MGCRYGRSDRDDLVTNDLNRVELRLQRGNVAKGECSFRCVKRVERLGGKGHAPRLYVGRQPWPYRLVGASGGVVRHIRFPVDLFSLKLSGGGKVWRKPLGDDAAASRKQHHSAEGEWEEPSHCLFTGVTLFRISNPATSVTAVPTATICSAVRCNPKPTAAVRPAETAAPNRAGSFVGRVSFNALPPVDDPLIQRFPAGSWGQG